MDAQPASPRIITKALITSANITFCHAIRVAALAIVTDCGTACILEVINTTSAASIAASAPLPIAAPTSAPASTGASLMPSPTNITAPCLLRISWSFESFSCGRRRAWISSIPISDATAWALSAASPVSIAVVMCISFRELMAPFASGLMVSEINKIPAREPLTARKTSVPQEVCE